MRKIGLFGTLIVGALMFVWSCDEKEVLDKIEQQQVSTLNVTQVYRLSDSIGDWDFAYVAPEGFYCYQEDYAMEKKTRASVADTSSLSVLTWQSPDGKLHATFTMDKETKLPVKLVTDNDIFNFVFLNDSILELVHQTKDGSSSMSDSIFYNRTLLIQTITAAYTSSLQQFAAYAKELLKNAMSRYPEAKTICDMVARLVEYDIVDVAPDSEEFNNLQLPVSEDGDYMFAVQADNWVEDNVITEFYKISLWTGNAKFKVGGSSGSLDGSVICDASGFNQYGTYGILVDQDPAKLLLGVAEYNEVGLQADDETSFEVNFRGFLPNTTYYYTTYFKFNTSDHGSFSFRKEGSDTEVQYADYKSFSTGDNRLSVDVVMCIDFTGSMHGIIETVKSNAMSFYDQFKACCERNEIELLQMRSEVIAFQDSADNISTWLKHSPVYDMSTQQSDFDAFVSEIDADDGGDIPESGLEALDMAFSKTDWCPDDGYHRQVVILWTDAPYLKVVEMDTVTECPFDFDTIPEYYYYMDWYYDYDLDSMIYYADTIPMYEIDPSSGKIYPTFGFFETYGWEYYNYFYEEENYIKSPYQFTTLTPEILRKKWDAMPTGKRLILFAPQGDYYYQNGGSWDVFDSWPNVIHEGYTSSSFGDFEYILESIVGELTGKKVSSAPKRKMARDLIKIVPSKNRYY